MIRWIFNLGVLLSLFCLLVSVIMGSRSMMTGDLLTYGRYGVASYDAHLVVVKERFFTKFQEERWNYESGPVDQRVELWAEQYASRGGINVSRIGIEFHFDSESNEWFFLAIPFWLTVFISSVLPTWWWLLFRRRRRSKVRDKRA